MVSNHKEFIYYFFKIFGIGVGSLGSLLLILLIQKMKKFDKNLKFPKLKETSSQKWIAENDKISTF